MAYDGPIIFTMDRRNPRNATTVRFPPVSEIRLLNTDVPDLPEVTKPLPLANTVSLTLLLTLRELVSTHKGSMEQYQGAWESREAMAKTLPFHIDPRTGSIPISITQLSECEPLYTEDNTLIGFASFDESSNVGMDLFCAHISTLRGACKYTAAEEARAAGGKKFVAPQPPILAYALVLKHTNKTENEYCRVGFAEVNYEWMVGGSEKAVKLV